MKVKKEAIIGMFAFAMLLLLYWGVNYLNKSKLLKSLSSYYVVYPNAGGLERKSPILINGVTIGSVSNIELSAKHHHVIVTLQVSSAYQLPTGTTACISSGGLLDKKSITLHLAPADSYYRQNDTISSGICGGDIMAAVAPVAAKADSLMSQLNTLISSMQGILNEQNQANLSATMRNMAALSNNLNRTAIGLNQVISSNKDNLSATMANMSEASSSFKEVSNNLRQNNDKIASLIANADSTMANANQLTTTLNAYTQQGKLMHVMQNDDLYKSLNRAVVSLDSLLKDLQRHPDEYVHFSVFGGKKKK
ncbi:MAG: MlaD family protein [Prevotellaceae bacterium]|jgi:phospholipid/cholesterol/gamma-HCH transport system substrate-binding protein|nr:MlaD family protein [Prevotellaceae bacterium]